MMTGTKSNPLARLLPSLTDVAFLIPLILIFGRMGGAKVLLGDGDTGWHVRTGEWILQHGRIPHQDIFSFTKAGEPWFAWEWLWDLGFGWMHRQWGLPAVVLTSVLIICVVSALLFRLVQRTCPNVLIAIAVSVLAMAATAVHWLARPHLFTLLLTAVFYWLLERVREGRANLLWWLLPLMVIWTNLHGGFLVGIILTLTYAIAELLTAALAATGAERIAAGRKAVRYLVATAGCAAATLINPYSYHLHTHIYRFLSDSYLRDVIVEYQPFNFHAGGGGYVEIIVLLGAATALWDLLHRRFGDAVLLLSWAHLALLASRNIPIFAILAAPPAARMLYELLAAARESRLAGWAKSALGEFERTELQVRTLDRLPRLYAASAVMFAMVAAAFFLPKPPAAFRAEYDATHYPAKALEILHRSYHDGRIFTNDDWGDYLAYRLYPGGRVFVDGRFDFYGSDFCARYLDTMRARSGWEENLNRYAVDTVLLDVGAPLAGTLKESSRWRAVYDDGLAIIFRHAGTEFIARGSSLAGAKVSAVSSGGGVGCDQRITGPKT